MQENINVAAGFIERRRSVGHRPADLTRTASALFWMVGHEMYELFGVRRGRATEIEVMDTLALLWQRAVGVA
ncbi:hypothetical protein ACWGQ5_20465 [Streptomyces sp. NPDC055722]